jgi:hypothetical protein
MSKDFTNSEVLWRTSDVTDGSTIDGNFSFGILTLRHGLIRFLIDVTGTIGRRELRAAVGG